MISWIVSAIIIALNGMLLFNLLSGWVALPPPASTLAWFAAVPVAAVCLLLLAWIVVRPLVPARRAVRLPAPLEAAEVLRGLVVPAVRRAGLALDRTLNDKAVLSYGLGLARDRETELVLVHVVAGIGAQVYGSEVGDLETREARDYLEALCADLGARGIRVRSILGFGVPSTALVEIAKENQMDLLVLGGHGHRLLGDMLKGETISPVRHAVTIPVVTIRRTQAGEDGK